MKIIFLCKRYPQKKDLIKNPYGRFYYIPKLLSDAGHTVKILFLSYDCEGKKTHFFDKLECISIGIFQKNISTYYKLAKETVESISPDFIVGCSDIYYGVLAQHLASKFESKSVIDAYDNYESYIPWFKPLHSLWRRCLENADIVTAAGPQLAEIMGRNRKDKPTFVIPMSADPVGFKPLDKNECRKILNLPLGKKLIGYCGAINNKRGIKMLFEGYEFIKKENRNVELVMSGRKAKRLVLPEGVNWFGYLCDKKIPLLLNSMDVLTVINKPSSFGNYSYPVKLYEAMCCQVPVVATATLSTKWILRNFHDLLITADDNVIFGKKVIELLKHDKIDYGHEQGWNEEATCFEEILTERMI